MRDPLASTLSCELSPVPFISILLLSGIFCYWYSPFAWPVSDKNRVLCKVVCIQMACHGFSLLCFIINVELKFWRFVYDLILRLSKTTCSDLNTDHFSSALQDPVSQTNVCVSDKFKLVLIPQPQLTFDYCLHLWFFVYFNLIISRAVAWEKGLGNEPYKKLSYILHWTVQTWGQWELKLAN